MIRPRKYLEKETLDDCLKQVQKGDKFKVTYTDITYICKCLNNDLNNRKLKFSLYIIFGIIPFGITSERGYDAYNFENFKELNTKTLPHIRDQKLERILR